MQVSSTVWYYFPAGRCTCSYSKVGSRLDCCQIQWTFWQRWIATNSPDINTLDCHVWGFVLERYKRFQPKPNNTDGLMKVLQLIWDQLPQDSRTRPYWGSQRHLSLYERWDGHLEYALRKMFNDVEHWMLQVTVHFFGIIMKYRIKYCKSCNSWSNANILAKFSRIVANTFRCISRNFGNKNFYLLSRNCTLSSGTFFQPPGILLHFFECFCFET